MAKKQSEDQVSAESAEQVVSMTLTQFMEAVRAAGVGGGGNDTDVATSSGTDPSGDPTSATGSTGTTRARQCGFSSYWMDSSSARSLVG